MRSSLPTVATLISNACATSSMLSPPKKRISTTFALRSSKAARLESASSSASNSSERSSLKTVAPAFGGAVGAGVVDENLAH